MDSLSDPGGSMDTESDTGRLGDVNGDGGLLLRLPVEVYLRVLDFAGYPELLSLSRCNQYFRKRTLSTTARAGFSGPLTRLRTVLPRVKDLAWSVPEKVDWFETKLGGIRSLKVLCVKGNVFSVNSTRNKPKEVLAPDLEHFEVYVDSASYGSRIQFLDLPILVLLKGLLPLPRLKSLDLRSCPGLMWRQLGFLLCPRAAPTAVNTVSPLPRLETLKLELCAEDFLGFLSALEDPAALPALKRLDLRITGPRSGDTVDRAPLIQAMASRPTPSGSRLLRFSEVKIGFGSLDPNSHQHLWGPDTSLATKQAALCLDVVGQLDCLLQLLTHPPRTIPTRSIIAALCRWRSVDVLTEDVPPIVDAIMADLCPTPDLDTPDTRLKRLAMLKTLYNLLSGCKDGFASSLDKKLGRAMWDELISRPAFLSLLISSVRQPSRQAKACMALLRVMPDDLLYFSLFDQSRVACHELTDVLSVINYFLYTESRTTTQDRGQSSLGCIMSALKTAPPPLRDQVLALRLPRLVKVGIELEVLDERVHPSTAKLLEWLGTMEGMWPRLQPLITAGVLDFARLVLGIGSKDQLMKDLLTDEDAMTTALRLMDNGVESSVTGREIVNDDWSALFKLLQEECFRQRVSGRYSEEDITAVLLMAASPLRMRDKTLSVPEALHCLSPGTWQADSPHLMDLLLRCARSTQQGLKAGERRRVGLVTEALFELIREIQKSDEERFHKARVTETLPSSAFGVADMLRSETGRSLLELTMSFTLDNSGDDGTFRHYRWQVVEILRHAFDDAGDPVLAKGRVDLTWLHRPFCALALTSCERLLRQLPAGAILEATRADPVLEGVAGLYLLLDMRSKESASLITCLRELASKQPAAARVLASVLDSLFQQGLDNVTTASTTEASCTESHTSQRLLSFVRNEVLSRGEGFVPSLIQSLQEVIGGLPTNINNGGDDAEASATEGDDQGSGEPFGGADKGEDAGEGEGTAAKGVMVNDDSEPKAKRQRGERKVDLFEPFLAGLGGEDGAGI